MAKDKNTIPLTLTEGIEILKRELSRERLIVFVGSGMSMSEPSKLPDWDSFIKSFIRHCKRIFDLLPPNAKESYIDLIKDAEIRSSERPIQVASVLNDTLKELDKNKTLNINIEDSYKNWFIETFAGKPYNPNHKLITSINFPYILTSNYDMLLEKALEDFPEFESLSLKSYTFSEAEKIAASLFTKEFAIIHMHGKFQNIALDEIVFTSEDYSKMLRRSYPGFTMSIMNLFSNYSTLFIGYGGSDPHLEDVLEEQAFNLHYANNSGLPQNYMIALRSKVGEIYSKHKHKRRTRIIAIDSYNDYEVLLKSLQKDYPRKLKLINPDNDNFLL
jgi:SIR2-like domain